MLQSKYPCMHSYSTNDVIDVDENRDSYVFKKFINAAIYVEKTIKRMAPDYQNYQKRLAESIRIMKTKRCSCSIDADSCPFHPSMASGDGVKEAKSETQMDFKNREVMILEEIQNRQLKETYRPKPLEIVQLKSLKQQKEPIKQENRNKSFKLNLEDGITPNAVTSETILGETKINEEQEALQVQMKKVIEKLQQEISTSQQQNCEEKLETKTETLCDAAEELKVMSGSSSNTASTSTLSNCSQITIKRSDKAFKSEMKLSLSSLTSFTPTENGSVRSWLSKKLEEQKKKQQAIQDEERKKEIERQKILEKERENFKQWLAAKKKKEEKKKAEMERQQQLDQLRELEKEKRHLENQIKYQIWLKRKEEADQDKKNQEQLKSLQEKIEKEKRIIANQRAFQEWLESSKNKPKPIPLNKGLDSLRSSLSVTYVNPVPWVPNIDHKPASQ